MAIAGTYDIVTRTPLGDQKGAFTVNLNADGDSFTGTVSSPLMGSMAVTNGQVSGQRLTWKMDMTVPMPIALDCEATVEGDAITGVINAGAFGTMALSGTRAG